MVFTILTVYEELYSGNIINKVETTTNGRAAKEAFSIYIMDPDCAQCDVITDEGQTILHWEQVNI